MHVGSAQTSLKISEENIRRVLNKWGGITSSAIKEVLFEEEYAPFNTAGKVPTIPGSTIKGNVRARLELSFRAKHGKVRSCFIKSGLPIARTPLPGEQGWRHNRIWGGVLMEDRGASCDLTRFNKVCLLCDLFGTAGLRSLIEFEDFRGKDVKLMPLNLEYNIRVMAAPPGSSFLGNIYFYNLKGEELGLLFLGMGLGRNVLLGRFKYRGKVAGKEFGRVRYEVNSISLVSNSEPLHIDELKLPPGDMVEGEEARRMAMSLKDLALQKFNVVEVDEVGVIERL